ncbi:MAG: HAD family hydrolase [Candidatus Methanosuratincola sp.]|jgi:putative hydrolase of the HAD superfamily|nr:HAD family hydrolase [Candidatus Methanosuratincola sp.]
MRISRISTISFDMDGTLVTPSFANLIWLEVLPQMVSESWGIGIDEAKAQLFADYKSIGPNRMEWYDLSYWTKRYRLEINPRRLLLEYKEAVTIYPEVIEVLEDLKGRFDLVVTSNSHRLFLDVTSEPLDKYFKRKFSTISDFGMMKDTASYRMVCEELGIKPSEMVHVGDSLELDYTRARRAGVRAFYLDRDRKRLGRRFIPDLRELRNRLQEGRV